MLQHNAATTIATKKRQGDRLIGCFPLYPPVELFASMDLLPAVLWGLKSSIQNLSESDKHVQHYACAVGRELMQFVLSDSGALLDGIFSYNACDTLRNFPEILNAANAELGRDIPMLRMHVPQVNRGQTDPGNYLKNEIAGLIDAVEKSFGVAFSPEKFRQTTGSYEQMRSLCIKAERQVSEGALSFGDFCTVVLAGYALPVAEQIQNLKSLIDKAGIGSSPEGTGVLVSGIMPPPAAVVAAMENAGLRVAANDIASLRRSYAYSPAATNDPGEYYTDFFANRFPCPTLLYLSDDRLDEFLRLVTVSGARGVIFSGEKFCEYEYFEFPYLEKKLFEMGIPVLILEFGADDELNIDAYATRIEAFAEMLNDGPGRKGGRI